VGKGTTLVHCDRTDIGRRRSNNQDAKAVLPPSSAQQFNARGWLFLVADGMGAHAAGEKASAIAAEQVPLFYEKAGQLSPPLTLRHSIEQANAEINRQGESAAEFKGMGTTCTTLVILPRGALIGHIGDSRAYRIRGKTVDQLSKDHSLVWELETAGGLTREEANNRAPKNIITRSMGPHPQVVVDLEGPFPVEDGDVFLLCSDGLSGQVTDEEIGLFAAELEPREATETLIRLALVRGAPDNVTVIVAKAGSEEVSKPSASDKPWAMSAIEHVDLKGQPIPWKMLAVAAVSLFASLVLISFWLTERNTPQSILIPVYLFGAVATGLVALVSLIAAVLGFSSPQAAQVRVLPIGSRLGKGPYRTYDCSPTALLLEGVIASVEAASDGLAEPDKERTVGIVARVRQYVAEESFHEAIVAAAEAIAIYGRALQESRTGNTAHGNNNPTPHPPA